MSRLMGLLLVVAIVLFVAVAPKGLTDQTFAPAAAGLKAMTQQPVIAGSIANSAQSYGQQVKGASIDFGNAATDLALFVGALFVAFVLWLLVCSIGRKNAGKAMGVLALLAVVIIVVACSGL